MSAKVTCEVRILDRDVFETVCKDTGVTLQQSHKSTRSLFQLPGCRYSFAVDYETGKITYDSDIHQIRTTVTAFDKLLQQYTVQTIVKSQTAMGRMLAVREPNQRGEVQIEIEIPDATEHLVESVSNGVW